MEKTTNLLNNLYSKIQAGGKFIFWSILFASIYSPGLVYSSNQNQYFLHGFAKAKVGFLDQDWFTTTLDLKPVFSSLIEFTQKIFNFSEIYYFYYAIILGIYFYSCYGIVSIIFKLDKNKNAKWIFIAVFLFIHSAALRFILIRGFGESWSYLFDGGFAGQRILGAVFQPASFGVLLILAVKLFLENKIYLAAILAALAGVFHPSILHVSFALILSFMVIPLIENKNFKKAFFIGLLAFLVVLPMVIYLVQIVSPTSPELAEYAENILINIRIPHHTNLAAWFDITTIIKGSIIVAAILVTRKEKIVYLLLIPSVIMLVLTAAQITLNSNKLALMNPWRISVFIMPISSAILLGWIVQRIISKWQILFIRHQKAVKALISITIIALTLVGGYKFSLIFNDRAASDEQKIFNYVSESKESGQVYLIPKKMEDFRLETGAPAFVDFKSIPIKDSDLKIWLERFYQLQIFTRRDEDTDICYQLTRLNIEYGVTHIIQSSDLSDLDCEGIIEVYQNDSYIAYEMSLQE